MTVAELKELLQDYRDDMELFIVAEEVVGGRRMLYGIHDFSDFDKKVFLSGRLSKLNLPRDMNPSLAIN